MENIIVFNYVIVLFSITILLGFFIYNVNRYYTENDDLNQIIENSEKICVKINYNGNILNYNKRFQALTINPKAQTLIDSELLKVIKLKDSKPMISFINELEEKNLTSMKLEIINSENKIVMVNFVISSKKNLFGVVNQYILVGTDISGNENVISELNSIKEKNKKLHAELAYSEEELQRNFEQIKYKQNEVNIWFEKHRLFMNSITEGVLEYDFYSRQFFISRQFHLLYSNDYLLENERLNFNELLSEFIDALTEDSYYNLLEKLYISINKKIDSFEFQLEFKSRDNMENKLVNVKCDLFLDRDGELFYFVLTTFKK